MRKKRRIAQVKALWEDVVTSMYGNAAPFVLSHTNAVYILASQSTAEKNAAAHSHGKQLVVYLDDSMVRSDLDCRREFVKLKLAEKGEIIEEVRLYPSKRDMRQRHPYRKKTPIKESIQEVFPFVPAEATKEAYRLLLERANDVESPRVREALVKAIQSSVTEK